MSEEMEGPVRRLAPRARFALRAALLLAALMGVGGTMSSCGMLRFYQQPRPTPTTDVRAIVFEVFEHFRATHLPLAVANLLLSVALLVAVIRTVTRRAGAKSWLRQVCIASALYVAAEHVVTRPERGYVDELLRARPVTNEDDVQFARAIRLGYEARPLILLAQLAFFGAFVFALGRPSIVLELAPRDPNRPSPPSADGDGDA